MRTSIRAAVAAMVLLLLASGCSDGEPSPRDPSSTWSPTGKIETPTSAAPDPVEPELPAAAKEATEAGARAFIEYYWELINYAQVTGDVKTLKSVSGARCDGCQSGVDAIRSLYEGGGHIEGGEYTAVVKKMNRLQGDALIAFEALLTVKNVEQVVLNGDGSEHKSAAGTASVAVACQWTADSWHMEVMDQQ